MSKRVKQSPIPPPQPLQTAETLGAFVRASRTQARMGIHEAAAFCGVAVGTMQKIECARGDVKLSSVLTVCKMLGVSINIELRSEKWLKAC